MAPDQESTLLEIERLKLEQEKLDFAKKKTSATQSLPLAIAFAGLLVSATQIWISHQSESRKQDLDALKLFVEHYDDIFKGDAERRGHIQSLIATTYGKNQLVLFREAYLSSARSAMEYISAESRLRAAGGVVPSQVSPRVYVLFSSRQDTLLAERMLAELKSTKGFTASEPLYSARQGPKGMVRYFSTTDADAANDIKNWLVSRLKESGVTKEVDVEQSKEPGLQMPPKSFEVLLPVVLPEPVVVDVPKFTRKGT